MSLALGAGMVALVLAAPFCGGGEAPRQEPDLVLTDFAFEPAQLTAVAGKESSFIVRNAGDVAHNVTIEAFGVDADFDPVITEFVDVAPDQPGSFAFFCKFHPEQMVGELTVE